MSELIIKEPSNQEISQYDNSSLSITSGASLSEVVRRMKLIDDILHSVMKKGVHYDVIPGTQKPTLLKPGAEKLCALFNLGTELVISRQDIPGGHREYVITCTVKHYPSNRVIGQGIGSCSTMESKYRYRNVSDYKVEDSPIPEDYKEKKKEYRAKGYGAKKTEHGWIWVKYTDSERQENPDVADTYNTVLKMAKKRSLVDAVLTATGSSDLFTQDMEEVSELAAEREPRVEEQQEEKQAEQKKKTYMVSSEKRSFKKKEQSVEKQEDKKLPEGDGSFMIIDAVISDIEEEEKNGNRIFTTLIVNDDRQPKTLDRDLAVKVFDNIGNKVSLRVRPTRVPGNLELLEVIESEK